MVSLITLLFQQCVNFYFPSWCLACISSPPLTLWITQPVISFFILLPGSATIEHLSRRNLINTDVYLEESSHLPLEWVVVLFPPDQIVVARFAVFSELLDGSSWTSVISVGWVLTTVFNGGLWSVSDFMSDRLLPLLLLGFLSNSVLLLNSYSSLASFSNCLSLPV